MAFWGVELRPGSPFTHRYDPSRGRLRVSQAALINCDVVTRTQVQCSIGRKKPITICSLNPRLAEMCNLEFEFEEGVDVRFSVLGPSSVHLSGYFLRSTSNINIARDQPSSESYGEDIGESDNESIYENEEDSYESDFIDDGDVEVSENNYVSDSMDDGDYEKQGFEKHSRKVELQRCLEKKHQADNIDDSPCIPIAKRNRGRRSIFYISSSSSSEDEGFFTRSELLERQPMAFALSNKSAGKGLEKIKPKNVMSNAEMEKESKNARKRKCDAINHDPAAPREVTEVNGSCNPEPEAEKHKKSKRKNKNPSEQEDGKHSNNIRTLEDGLMVEDLSAGNRDAKVASKGNKVYINYVGKLQDGKIVDSNAGEKPYKFILGAEKVIRGWDLGIVDMCVGGKRKLTIPPSLRGIGAKSAGDQSSAYSTIIYEVELVKVRSMK